MRTAALIACLSSMVLARVGAPLGEAERAALAGQEQAALESLRAASGETPARLSAVERSGLEQVQAQSAGLEELRAGGPTVPNVKLILKIIAGVLVLIAILH